MGPKEENPTQKGKRNFQEGQWWETPDWEPSRPRVGSRKTDIWIYWREICTSVKVGNFNWGKENKEMNKVKQGIRIYFLPQVERFHSVSGGWDVRKLCDFYHGCAELGMWQVCLREVLSDAQRVTPLGWGRPSRSGTRAPPARVSSGQHPDLVREASEGPHQSW